MRSPIIAIESEGEIHVFKSVGAAESYLEPLDVERNEYEVYDSDGTRLSATIEKRRGFWSPKRVRIVATSDKQVEALRRKLADYLSRLHGHQQIEGYSLDDLVSSLQDSNETKPGS